MTADEAREIYASVAKENAERFSMPYPINVGHRSNADFSIARTLHRWYGYDPDDIAAVLMFASHKAEERGLEYVVRTVNAALNWRG